MRRMQFCHAAGWKSSGEHRAIGKNTLERVNQVRSCRGHMPAVVFIDSERDDSGSRHILRLMMGTQRPLRLLPPADFIALFLQTARDGIGIWRFRFQRLERSSK